VAGTVSRTASAEYIAPFKAKVSGNAAVFSFAEALSIAVLASLRLALALVAIIAAFCPLNGR